jgi:hypothetical protein
MIRDMLKKNIFYMLFILLLSHSVSIPQAYAANSNQNSIPSISEIAHDILCGAFYSKVDECRIYQYQPVSLSKKTKEEITEIKNTKGDTILQFVPYAYATNPTTEKTIYISTEPSISSIQGSQGAQGSQGSTGPQGAKGDKGDTGPQGPSGGGSLTAGTGLVNSNGTVSLDLTASPSWTGLQIFTNGIRLGGTTITSIDATMLSANSGVLGIADGAISLSKLAGTACNTGEILKSNGTSWNCGTDNSASNLTTGHVTTATNALTITGGSNAIIGSGLTLNIATADTSHDGLLLSTDWNTFSSKESAITNGTATQFWAGNKTWKTIPTCSGTDKLTWNGTSFVCAADAGSVTSITAGSGLTGGTITTTGTLALDLTSNNTWSGIQTFSNAILNGTISGTAIDTDGALTANSDTKLASQKAVKTYTDLRLSGLNWKTPADVLDTSLTSLPATTATTADGFTIVDGSKAIFTNLSVNNNRVCTATVTGANISWNCVAPTQLDTLFIKSGNTNANKQFTYNGSSWIQAGAMSGSLLIANNLSDVLNISTARSNLGLGTGSSPTFTGLTLSGAANGAVYISSGVVSSEANLSVVRGGTGVGTLTGLVVGTGTNALTGITNSLGIINALSDETGSGSLVFGTSPALTTPSLGAASASSINGLSLSPQTDGLTLAGGSTSRTLSISGNNVSLNQNLRTTDNPTFNGLTVNGTGGFIVGSVSNGLNVSSGGVLSYTGTARPTKAVFLSPEYDGAVLTGDGSNNSGTMTSDFCSYTMSLNTGVCGVNGDQHNYYSWTTTQGTAQDYDIYIQYKLPSDFSALNGSITAYGWRTTANDSATVQIYDVSTSCGSAATLTSSNTTWTSNTLATGLCTLTAGDVLLFKIHLTATNGNYARIGEISFNYYSSF